MKQFGPRLTEEEIEKRHKHFSERISLFKSKGLDLTGSRKVILEKAYPMQGSILEIGSGSGYTTISLAKEGYRFLSVDKDEEALKTAASNLAYEGLLSNVTFYMMDAKSLEFSDRSIMNVITVNFFHHAGAAHKVLSEIDRVLCVGGKVVSADFNKRGMEFMGAFHAQEGRQHEDSGVSKDDIHSYFYSLGYRIESFEDEFHWVLVSEKKA